MRASVQLSKNLNYHPHCAQVSCGTVEALFDELTAHESGQAVSRAQPSQFSSARSSDNTGVPSQLDTYEPTEFLVGNLILNNFYLKHFFI